MPSGGLPFPNADNSVLYELTSSRIKSASVPTPGSLRCTPEIGSINVFGVIPVNISGMLSVIFTMRQVVPTPIPSVLTYMPGFTFNNVYEPLGTLGFPGYVIMSPLIFC